MNTIKQLLDNLDAALTVKYQAVNYETNPVAVDFDDYSTNEKIYVLAQYSLFSRYIVRFLIEVLYKTSMGGLGLVAAEMQRNLAEELSDGENGDPHYVLLIKGFLLALNKNLYSVEASKATRSFEQHILTSIHDGNSAFATGVAYALESSAVPELIMTRTFVDRLFAEFDIEIPTAIRRFFGSHIGEIEVMHKSRLRDVTIDSFSTADELFSYGDGFDIAMNCMNDWWIGLADEVRLCREHENAASSH